MHKYSGKFATGNCQLSILTLYLTYVNKKEAHSHEQTSQTLHKHYKLQAFSKTKNILTNNSNTNIYQIPIENKYISKKRGAY